MEHPTGFGNAPADRLGLPRRPAEPRRADSPAGPAGTLPLIDDGVGHDDRQPEQRVHLPIFKAESLVRPAARPVNMPQANSSTTFTAKATYSMPTEGHHSQAAPSSRTRGAPSQRPK
ncbi:hypothetical protein [Streptomyces sp. NPDC057740]|uniref:hypothetical protein n=1 Tax=Streptomyces sp. NPDC057740 TaxID=3346234 RepID=UPI00367CE792